MSSKPRTQHEHEHGREEQATNPRMNRRTMLRVTGAAAGTVAAGAGAQHAGYDVSPVGDAEALAPLAGYAIAAAAGAAITYWKTREHGESETLTQAHRNLASTARGMDTASDNEKEFENLVAQRSENWVWQDAVLQFVEDYNNSDKTIPDLKSEMEMSILSDFGDLEQTIVDNQTTELVQLIEMFNHLEQYDHTGDAEQVIKVAGLSISNTLSNMGSLSPDDENSDVSLSDYNLDGTEDLVNPFGSFYDENQTSTDDLIYIDYERVDGTTFEAAIGYGNISLFDQNTKTEGLQHNRDFTYYDSENSEITSIDVKNSVNSHAFAVPDDMDNASYDSAYLFADASRRSRAVSKIRSEAESLASEVSDWVDAIANEYARGDLPKADVVSASRLREEYGYEEGNASMTALYGSQLGFETDLKGTISIDYYDGSTQVPANTDSYSSNDEYENIESMEGYLMADHANGEEISLQSGQSYTVADVVGDEGQLILTRPSGDTVELESSFTVTAIRSYEDGEQVEKDSFTTESYNFSPRDPNRYEEDVEDANDAREDATSNPEINVGLLDGLSGLGGNKALLALALGVPVFGLILVFIILTLKELHPAT